MTRALSLLAVFGLVMVAGCGGHGQEPVRVGHGRASVRVTIKITTGFASSRRTQSFSLTCDPAGGTLPFAARVCADIARHPQAMLAPAKERSTCSEPAGGPILTVTAARRGQRSTFEGGPFCNWPGGTPLGIYWAASRHDLHTITQAEPRLRCEDDPALLATPTPWTSVTACVHGLWTPRSEHLIRVAEQAEPLDPLNARQLFPHDIGAFPCTINAGPTPHQIKGSCGVNVTNVGSTPTITFVEAWPIRPGGRLLRHRWVVRITAGRATLIRQSGPTAPQLLE